MAQVSGNPGAAVKRTPGVGAGAGPTPQPVKKTPPFKIETPETHVRYLKLLIYGEYGVGKTYLAGTTADVTDLRDVLLINAESGDLTFDTDEHKFADIDRVTVKNFHQVARVQEFLATHCIHRDNKAKESQDKLRELESILKGHDVEKPKHYRTVILDSLTEIEAYCMYQLLGVSDMFKLDDDIPAAQFAEYKKNLHKMLMTVRKFRDLPMNVIMTCARQYTQDETKRMLFSPRLTGQLSSAVQGFMDVVGYLQMGQGEEGKLERRLCVQPNPRFAAKCRFSRFKKEYFVNPTIQSILKDVGLHN